VIVERLEQPLFVVAEQEAKVARWRGAERHEALQDAASVRAAVYVVAQKHEHVVWADLRQQAREEIVERGEVPVNVAYGDSRQ
jgi:hypothetical protein